MTVLSQAPSAEQSAEQLLEQHFDTAFAAPDGLKKLRELILTLAMQGKLVEQDPSDPPASELLKEIEQEKRRLVAAGQIKAPKPLLPIEADEVPYEVPQGWAWVRLGDIADSQAGFSFKSNKFNESGGGLPLIRIRDVGQPFTGTFYDGEYKEDFIVTEGEYLISMDGEFRVATWKYGKALLNQRVSRLSFYSDNVEQSLVARILQVRLTAVQGTKSYTTVDHLSGGQILAALIPLPPLPEQRRIVARIEQLMARCDELEALRNAQQQKRLDVHTAALSDLLGADTPEAFAQAWQFVAQHFGDLYSAPQNVAELRKAVLQLAVMGKLVPQDPADPPARELLREIEAEKRRLVAAGKIKAPKPLPPVKPEERPYEVPHGWEWVRLGTLINFTNGFAFKSNLFQESGVGVVKIGDISDGQVTKARMDFIDESYMSEVDDKFLVNVGDMLIAMSGATTGKLGINSLTEKLVMNQRVGKIEPVKTEKTYLFHYLSTQIQKNLDISSGSAIPNLSTEQINEMLTPLPPLPEQRRIVTKIDELMRLCDDLSAQLSAQTGTQSALLSSLMAAVTPASPTPERRPTLGRSAALREPAEPAASTQPKRRGRPAKAGSIPTATSEADAIRQLNELKFQRAEGTRQEGLFD
ncbi:restriction endonuclease subunit S [Deinococcus detaillensis]|uniref:Restriction endonuclease subunit S n=1 Tax=Deinococcus detaillensis TaxID=2592048 RepID=A0A553UK59_9DEIO|nr:restriction endonuclease subunit S [Deinococcus detaillensis]TSA80585.1 restriction endonuclease subunit S [Deinococcus detaillensis]